MLAHTRVNLMIIGLLNCLCREHTILIVITPKSAETYFLDSTRIQKKDYKDFKMILNKALLDCNFKGGNIKKGCQKYDRHGLLRFAHKTYFCCLQQPESSVVDDYHIIHHMWIETLSQSNLTSSNGARNAENLRRGSQR